jgi:hypothetical protein
VKQNKKKKYQIPRHILAYIEGELGLYQTYKSRLAEIDEEKLALLELSRNITLVHSSNSDSDKMATKAIQLAELENERIEMSLRIHKIESGLRILSDECRTIIENKYFWQKVLTNEQAIKECGYENYRNKFYELLPEAQYKIGVVFGVIL